MNTIFILGIVQGLFIIALLFSKKDKANIEYILMVWLSLIVGHLTISNLLSNGVSATP